MMRKVLDFVAKLIKGKERGIFYIGGCDILPPPLKGQEELAALERLEQGDEYENSA